MATYHSFLARLGFRLLPEHAATIDGQVYHVALLDFGPGSVDGWLANLVAAELTSVAEEAVALDVGAHELLVDGQPIGLTQLEFGVMQYLVEREGKAVSRGDLLEDVWGYAFGNELLEAPASGSIRFASAYLRRRRVSGLGFP
jgi:hypothetical protein